VTDRDDARTISCDEAEDLAGGYVLDALEPAEHAAVEAHLATCQEPHPEFASLGGVVPALLELDPSELVEPTPALGERIMAAAAADLAARPTRADTGREPIPFPSAGTQRSSAASARRQPGMADWILRIAAVLAIVAVGAWGLNLQGQLDRAHAFDRALAAVVHAAGQPGAKTVVLNAQKGYESNGIAAVQPDGSVVIAMLDLPATTGGQVYTAWVIVGSNAPVAVGDFAIGSAGPEALTTKPATTPAGATIALTLEPNAGNTAPQGPIVSAGVAAAPPGGAG
jgi:anti-sigma-K factor RskA